MITTERLLKVNEAIKTTDVKGKAYAEVNERIKAFRTLCPGGAIENEILSLENGVCVIKSTIKDEEGHLLGVGHAYEKEGSTYINKTSYIENCETSAVGPALGMVGIGIDGSVASAEEVINAIDQQKKSEKPSKVHLEALKMRLDEDYSNGWISVNEKDAYLSVIDTMDMETYRKTIDWLAKKEKDGNKGKA